MRFLRVLMLVAVSVLAVHEAKAWDPIPTETGDYCKDEALTFIRNRFPGVQVLELKKVGSSTTWNIWGKVDICSGQFVFEYQDMEGYNCTQAQYGSHVEFMRRVWATGDCRRLMPRDEYP